MRKILDNAVLITPSKKTSYFFVVSSSSMVFNNYFNFWKAPT